MSTTSEFLNVNETIFANFTTTAIPSDGNTQSGAFTYSLVVTWTYFTVYVLMILVVSVLCAIDMYKEQQSQYNTNDVDMDLIVSIIKKWGKSIWKKRRIYLPLIPHFFDQATDFGVIIEYYSLRNNTELGINARTLFILSICIIIMHRLISAGLVYNLTKNLKYCAYQVFDLLMVRCIYTNYELQSTEPSNAQRYLQTIEAIFESAPQTLISAAFLIKASLSRSSFIVILSLITSLWTLSARVSADDRVMMQEEWKYLSLSTKYPFLNPRYIVRVFLWRFLEISSRVVVLTLVWISLGGLSVFIVLGIETFFLLVLCYGLGTLDMMGNIIYLMAANANTTSKLWKDNREIPVIVTYIFWGFRVFSTWVLLFTLTIFAAEPIDAPYLADPRDRYRQTFEDSVGLALFIYAWVATPLWQWIGAVVIFDYKNLGSVGRDIDTLMADKKWSEVLDLITFGARFNAAYVLAVISLDNDIEDDLRTKLEERCDAEKNSGKALLATEQKMLETLKKKFNLKLNVNIKWKKKKSDATKPTDTVDDVENPDAKPDAIEEEDAEPSPPPEEQKLQEAESNESDDANPNEDVVEPIDSKPAQEEQLVPLKPPKERINSAETAPRKQNPKQIELASLAVPHKPPTAAQVETKENKDEDGIDDNDAKQGKEVTKNKTIIDEMIAKKTTIMDFVSQNTIAPNVKLMAENLGKSVEWMKNTTVSTEKPILTAGLIGWGIFFVFAFFTGSDIGALIVNSKNKCDVHFDGDNNQFQLIGDLINSHQFFMAGCVIHLCMLVILPCLLGYLSTGGNLESKTTAVLSLGAIACCTYVFFICWIVFGYLLWDEMKDNGISQRCQDTVLQWSVIKTIEFVVVPICLLCFATFKNQAWEAIIKYFGMGCSFLTLFLVVVGFFIGSDIAVLVIEMDNEGECDIVMGESKHPMVNLLNINTHLFFIGGPMAHLALSIPFTCFVGRYWHNWFTWHPDRGWKFYVMVVWWVIAYLFFLVWMVVGFMLYDDMKHNAMSKHCRDTTLQWSIIKAIEFIGIPVLFYGFALQSNERWAVTCTTRLLAYCLGIFGGCFLVATDIFGLVIYAKYNCNNAMDGFSSWIPFLDVNAWILSGHIGHLFMLVVACCFLNLESMFNYGQKKQEKNKCQFGGCFVCFFLLFGAWAVIGVHVWLNMDYSSTQENQQCGIAVMSWNVCKVLEVLIFPSIFGIASCLRKQKEEKYICCLFCC
eukprot:45937_1